MELQYIKALKEHSLRVNDLPEDAQTGISEINKILKGFSMIEKRGLKPTQSAMKNIKFFNPIPDNSSTAIWIIHLYFFNKKIYNYNVASIS